MSAILRALATIALAQITPMPASSGTSASTAPILRVTGTGALILIAVSVVVVSTVLLLPLILDLIRAYQQQKASLDRLVRDTTDGQTGEQAPLSTDEFRRLLSLANEAPTGTKGLVRSLIAFGIIVIVGGALVATLVSGAPDSPDLRKTIITSLLSVLATIIGFYFGSRTAETSGGERPSPPQPTPSPNQNIQTEASRTTGRVRSRKSTE